jgi:uncharacterized protein
MAQLTQTTPRTQASAVIGAGLALTGLATVLRAVDFGAIPGVQNFLLVFSSLLIEAVPFVLLGALVSAAIEVLVPARLFERMASLPGPLQLPASALAGIAFPVCECGSVPVARRLAAKGLSPAAAVTFMLAAPAVNPIVLVATAVAFPGQPQMVLARFLGSLLTSIAVGLVWWRVGGDAWVERARARVAGSGDGPRWLSFSSAARHDLWDAGGWLVVGAAAAATLQVLVPRSLLLAVADHPALVGLAICSEADAFVAASLREFSLTARLVFLVVGPAVDVKLIAMQSGVFGRQFAARFAPLTFVVAVTCALVVGQVVLR